MISLWKLREKKNVAQMPFVKNTPEVLVEASTQSQPSSESVAVMLLNHSTTKMTNFVVLVCFWTPLKTQRKITKF